MAEAMANRLTDWEEQIRASATTEAEIFCFSEVASTMDSARALFEGTTSRQPKFVVTKRQSNGRGRQGRKWTESQSGLYATFGFESPREIAFFSGFSLAVGAVVAPVLSKLGTDVKLKWPNDILAVDKKKLGGILVEVIGTANKNNRTTLLVGIGINIGGVSDELTSIATSLADLGADRPTVPTLAAQVLAGFIGLKQGFEAGGFQAYRNDWLSLSLKSGEPVSVDEGGEIVSGSYAGISDSGALLLNNDTGQRTITSGHVLRWG